MKLTITTPLAVVIEEDGVLVLSAEDSSGGFGIQPHHADFLTSLAVAVVSWKSSNDTRHYCAVRGGVLTVTAGREIAIATREAVVGEDLATLDKTILSRFQADADAERTERVDSTRLQLSAIRQIVSHLQGGRSGAGRFT
jgi:F-type H+-transporting ATPase subunit epsilon